MSLEGYNLTEDSDQSWMVLKKFYEASGYEVIESTTSIPNLDNRPSQAFPVEKI